MKGWVVLKHRAYGYITVLYSYILTENKDRNVTGKFHKYSKSRN